MSLQIENLRSALVHYQKAKTEHEREVIEQKLISRKKRETIFFWSGIGIIFTVAILFSIYSWSRRDGAFIEICRSGTVEEVRAALAKGMWDVNMTDSNGFTPYIASTNNPNREVTQVLLQAGAKPGNVRDLRKPAGCGVNNSIYDDAITSRPPLSEQEIIFVARKYGFEIVAHKNEYKKGIKDGKPSFSEKIVARSEETISGTVYFCTDSICWEEGYIIFSPDNFYHEKYSYWRNDEYMSESGIRNWLSKELSGSLLDRTVKALMELCY